MLNSLSIYLSIPWHMRSSAPFLCIFLDNKKRMKPNSRTYAPHREAWKEVGGYPLGFLIGRNILKRFPFLASLESL